jgi:hypothetical protein
MAAGWSIAGSLSVCALGQNISYLLLKRQPPSGADPASCVHHSRFSCVSGVNVPASEACHSASSSAEAKKPNFIFSGPCIVIYLRHKDQQDALFLLNLF